jgi:pimeloyl-ACP methyl ester carboxylesterase
MNVRPFAAAISLLCFLAVALLSEATGPAQSPAWQDLSGHQVRFLTVEKNVRLEVLDWGGTGRSIVLLAGSGNTAHVFDDIAPKFAMLGHVYGVTRRGFGASSRPTSGYDDQRLADDVIQVLDSLHIQSPVLMGHSMAGGELTTVGAQRSDRLSGLIYLDALGDPKDWSGSDLAYMELYRKLPAGIRTTFPMSEEETKSFAAYRDWQKRNFGFEFPESELRNIYETNLDGTKSRSNGTPGISKMIGEGQKRRDYSMIRVPVLAFFEYPRSANDILRGRYRPKDAEERAAMVAFNDATAIFVDRWTKNLKSGVPGAQIIDLPGAGHYVFLTREAEILKGVKRFVARLQ